MGLLEQLMLTHRLDNASADLTQRAFDRVVHLPFNSAKVEPHRKPSIWKEGESSENDFQKVLGRIRGLHFDYNDTPEGMKVLGFTLSGRERVTRFIDEWERYSSEWSSLYLKDTKTVISDKTLEEIYMQNAKGAIIRDHPKFTGVVVAAMMTCFIFGGLHPNSTYQFVLPLTTFIPATLFAYFTALRIEYYLRAAAETRPFPFFNPQELRTAVSKGRSLVLSSNFSIRKDPIDRFTNNTHEIGQSKGNLLFGFQLLTDLGWPLRSAKFNEVLKKEHIFADLILENGENDKPTLTVFVRMSKEKPDSFPKPKKKCKVEDKEEGLNPFWGLRSTAP